MDLSDIRGFALSFSEEDRAGVKDMVDDILKTGILTLGPYTERFEAEVARVLRVDARKVVAVSSGTAALEIALRMCAVPGEAVICPTNTFYATVHAIRRAGCRAVYADMDPETLSPSVEMIHDLVVTGKTSAVVIMHTGGYVSPDLPAIRRYCDDKGIFLVEDAAHAFGAWVGDSEAVGPKTKVAFRPAGTIGHFGAFSLFPTKTLTAGEGGLLICDREATADHARIYRDQGKTPGGRIALDGYAWRMSELNAAVGITHLASLEDRLERRQKIEAVYAEELGICHRWPAGLLTPSFYKVIGYPPDGMDLGGLPLSGKVYECLCHEAAVEWAHVSWGEWAGLSGENFPHAVRFAKRHICLPCHDQMRTDDVWRIAKAFRRRMAALNR